MIRPQRLARRWSKQSSLGLLLDGLSPFEGIAWLFHRQELSDLRQWVSHFQALAAVVAGHRLGLFDLLQEEKGLTVEEMAERLQVCLTPLRVLLVALEALSLIRCRDGKVSMRGFSRLFLGRQAVFSISPFLEFVSMELKAFSDLDTTIRTGEPKDEANIFNPSAHSQAYLLAVNRYLYDPARAFFQDYEAGSIKDAIMGSMGVSFAAALLEANPEAKITFGCLDHLVKKIPDLMKAYGVKEEAVISCSAHSGDPRKDTWGKEAFDLVFLTKKFVLHPEERLGEHFAAKAYKVLNPGGFLVIWETFYPDDLKADRKTALAGLQDLMASHGGALYTRSDIRRRLSQIGFKRIEFPTYTFPSGSVTFAVARK